MSTVPDIHDQLLAHASACQKRDLLLAQVVELRDAGKMRQARAKFAEAQKLQAAIARMEGAPLKERQS